MRTTVTKVEFVVLDDGELGGNAEKIRLFFFFMGE